MKIKNILKKFPSTIDVSANLAWWWEQIFYKIHVNQQSLDPENQIQHVKKQNLLPMLKCGTNKVEAVLWKPNTVWKQQQQQPNQPP